eukprot:761550-Hanusia_phi.AAC.12
MKRSGSIGGASFSEPTQRWYCPSKPCQRSARLLKKTAGGGAHRVVDAPGVRVDPSHPPHGAEEAVDIRHSSQHAASLTCPQHGLP